MDKPIISIIVPVYNVEIYLEKCVDSIIKQTFKSIEIILVDDGSTDNSGTICDTIALSDERIRVIHKENGGLSSARNVGIKNARGSYYGFIDSDDYIEPDMFEVLYRNIINFGADLSICGILDVFDGRDNRRTKNITQLIDNKEAIRRVLEGQEFSVNAVNKLYKKELFDGILYPVGKYTEDAFVIIEILLKCKKVVYTTEQKYYYYHRENSITTQKFTPKQFHVIEAYEKNHNIICNVYPDLKPYSMGRLCWANFIALDRMIASNSTEEYPKERDAIVEFLRKHFSDIIRCNFLTKARKFSMLALLISFNLYKRLSLINTNKKIKPKKA